MGIVEDVEKQLDEIGRTDPSLMAWVTVDGVGALAAAERLSTGSPRGPLHGVAIAVKDIIDVDGLPTRAGSKVLQDNIASGHAAVVTRAIQAGAIILGKTNTHEFAYGYVTPPTRNPWDLTRIPGGSSGGTAAAVAAGHVRMGLGTDTGGSIRVPAALCGVCGLKPRRGIVPMDGILPLSPRMDVCGPIGRRVSDVVRLWEVLCDSPADLAPREFSLGIPSPETFGDDVEGDVLSSYESAVEVVKRSARSSTDVDVPRFSDFDLPRASMVLPDALRVHKERGWWPEKSHLYGEETRSYLSFMEASMTEETIAAGEQEARMLVARFLAAFDICDVIATPSAPCGAPTHEQAAEVLERSPRRPIALKLGRLPSPANMADLAAVSVPCGFTSDGLPIGLQLIGRDEALLLSIAAQYEAATEWDSMEPKL